MFSDYQHSHIYEIRCFLPNVKPMEMNYYSVKHVRTVNMLHLPRKRAKQEMQIYWKTDDPFWLSMTVSR